MARLVTKSLLSVAVLLLAGYSPITLSARADAVSAPEAACYAARLTSHWDLATNTCVAGAPVAASCYQFNRDSAGCVNATSDSAGQKCGVNPWNNYCFRPVAPCASIVGSDATCVARSDCKVPLTGVCAVATAGPILYGATPATCASNGYFYDAFGPVLGKQCYGGLAEVSVLYPQCGIWSNYPAPAIDPCVSHGCTYDSDTGRCLPASASGGGTPSSVSMVVDFTVDNVAVNIVAQTAEFDVSIPVNEFFNPTLPRHHVIVVGTPPTASALRTPMAPGVCNSLASAQPAFDVGLPRVTPAYGDATGLTTFFLSTAQAAHALSAAFDVTTAAGLAVVQTIGNVSVGLNSSLVQSVLIPPTLDYVKQHVRISLPGAVAQCGASRFVNSTFTSYTIPISVVVRQGDNVVAATMNQYVTATTYGLVVTGATTANAFIASNDPVTDSSAATAYSAACPVGQQRRTWTIREKWTNPNPNTLVGLRSLADVSMVPAGQTQTVGSPTNCFGTTPVAVIPPTFPCPGGVCTTLVRFESRCATIGTDGNGLNKCVYQTASNHLADMGSADAYPAALDYKQSFYHYPREWTAGNEASATYVGATASGLVPDMVQVQLSMPTLPDTVTSAALAVDCVFLPTADSTLANASTAVASTDGTASTYDIRSTQLATDGTLFTLCYLRDPSIRQSFTLTIDMAGTLGNQVSYKLSPLDSRGSLPLYSYPTLGWSTLQHFLSHTPRQVTTGVINKMALVASAPGYDGYGVPAYWLYNQLPSVGYMQQFYVSVALPPTAGSTLVPTVVSRRLLQVSASADDELAGASKVMAFGISLSANETDSTAVLTTDMGSTKSSTSVSVGVAAGVGAATAIGAAAMVWLSGVGAAAATASSGAAASASAAVAGALGGRFVAVRM